MIPHVHAKGLITPSATSEYSGPSGHSISTIKGLRDIRFICQKHFQFGKYQGFRLDQNAVPVFLMARGAMPLPLTKLFWADPFVLVLLVSSLFVTRCSVFRRIRFAMEPQLQKQVQMLSVPQFYPMFVIEHSATAQMLKWYWFVQPPWEAQPKAVHIEVVSRETL